MKSPLSSIIALAIILTGSIGIVHAASGDDVPTLTPTNTESSIQIENPLLVDSIVATDDMHITVTFNQNIIRESVRVRIAKQSDESNIRIESFDAGTDAMSMSVTLTDPVEASTAYKMTIISAISESGVIIKDGADGIKEFTTPVDLIKFAPELNAPSNPNAVMIDEATTTGAVSETPAMTPSEEGVTEMTPSETAEELPLTGVDATVFIVIAAILGGILVFRRRQA